MPITASLRSACRRLLLATATVAAVSLPAWPVLAAQPAAQRPQQPATASFHAGDMSVPVNKSQVLNVDRPFSGLSVGNPDIADVVALSNRSIYVLGKKMGTTNLAVYGAAKELIAVVDINVTHDVEGLKSRLHDLMPGQPIEVRAVNDAVVLSGAVSSPEMANRALSVASRFAPDKVTNMLRVRGSQQVMLSVRVAEVTRTVARELGLKPSFSTNGGEFSYATIDPLDLSRYAAALVRATTDWMTLDFLIDALEEKGLVKVLAEPNLVAMSGDTANFLAGGEFPIPVAQNTTGNNNLAITVEFKQFGVSLAFTPTVVDGDVINLVVNPEVSQIDELHSVVLSGFRIPGLSTRRATTTVQLRDGQSFAIAGLLQSDFNDTIRQLPGIGEVPVVGALFRSSAFQRRETELVIIVTPHLVQPVSASALVAPTDGFIPPSSVDLFLMGRVEAPASGTVVPTQTSAVLGAQAGGGLTGPYGHIIK